MNRISLLAAGLLALCCATAAYADDSTRTLEASVPGSNLRQVSLSASVGEVRIEPSADGTVHVSVQLKPKEHGFWMFHWSGDSADLAQAQLHKTVEDGVLHLSLKLPSADNDNGDDNGAFEQKWSIRMPPALSVDTDVKVGEVRIDGLAGGVTAETKVGEIRIRVPKGSVHAHVKVGELDVTTGAAGYRHLEIAASIGDVNLHGLDTSGNTQEHSGLGRHVSMQGDGTDDFDLASEIGEVNLTFGEQP